MRNLVVKNTLPFFCCSYSRRRVTHFLLFCMVFSCTPYPPPPLTAAPRELVVIIWRIYFEKRESALDVCIMFIFFHGNVCYAMHVFTFPSISYFCCCWLFLVFLIITTKKAGEEKYFSLFRWVVIVSTYEDIYVYVLTLSVQSTVLQKKLLIFFCEWTFFLFSERFLTALQINSIYGVWCAYKLLKIKDNRKHFSIFSLLILYFPVCVGSYKKTS